jgi:hypothetical protein
MAMTTKDRQRRPPLLLLLLRGLEKASTKSVAGKTDSAMATTTVTAAVPHGTRTGRGNSNRTETGTVVATTVHTAQQVSSSSITGNGNGDCYQNN